MEVDDHLIVEALKAFPEVANMTHYVSPLEKGELLGMFSTDFLRASGFTVGSSMNYRNIRQGGLSRRRLFRTARHA